MTFNECKFCFYMFCTYYDGKNIQDIPNTEGMYSGVKIDVSKMMIHKGSYHTKFNTNYPLFYFSDNDPNTFKLNYLTSYKGERKYYSSVNDFLNHFKITLKDIV